MTEIHEHTVDLSLLPECANILDLGARGFQFTNYMRSLGHKVTPVDIDEFPEVYYRVAITGHDGRVGIERTNDPQGTRIKEGTELLAMTLETFSKSIGIEFWDLIKMDIEGSEYDVIKSLKKAPARQLSIEFHLHTGAYGQEQLTEMESILKGLGYRIVSHELSDRHGAGFNMWDSLFVLVEGATFI